MKEVLSIYLLLALVSPGALLECYNCFGSGCETPGIQKCKDGQDTCISTKYESILASLHMANYRMVSKNCAQASACFWDEIRISTVDNATVRSRVKCCSKDRCNNASVSLPESVALPPNGIKCPACYEFNSTKCQKRKIINCTGEETKCIKVASKISADFMSKAMNVYFEGCATPATCYVPLPNALNSNEKMKYRVSQWECTEGDLNM